MQINNSRLIWLLLTFVFVLIHARNIDWDFNNQLDDDNDNYNTNEQQRHLYSRRLSPSMAKKVFNSKTPEQLNSYEQDRLLSMTRQAKAIIKGDPREFMG